MDSVRNGRFTSSEIWKLTTNNTKGQPFGAQGLTYINKKRLERKMKRSLSVPKDSRATLWGKMMERRVHELLPTKYTTQGDKTLVHPDYSFWAGSPDNIIYSEKVAGDTKCYEPENFACYTEMLLRLDIDEFRKEYKEEYWQLVSNACILGYDLIEAITYMPYESELPEIRLMAENYDGPDFYKYRFISEAPAEELPLLPDNSDFKNLNIIRFEVPKADKELLTKRVLMAEKLITHP